MNKLDYYVIDISDNIEFPSFGPFSSKKSANNWITKDYRSIANDSEIGDYTLKYLVVQIKDTRYIQLESKRLFTKIKHGLNKRISTK